MSEPMSIEDRIARYLHDYPTGYAADINENAILREAEAEIRSLRKQLSTEWGTGYDEGHADGIAEASKGRAVR